MVAGARAQYKGSGQINGAGNDGFLLTAIDGALPGGGGQDKFRIKIWDKNQGDGTNGNGVIYDNQRGASDTDDLSTVIGGGNIVIHTNGGSGGQGPTDPGNGTGDGPTPNPDLVEALRAEAARPQQAAVVEREGAASPRRSVGSVPMEVSVRTPGESLMPETVAVPSAAALLSPGPDRQAERLQLLDDLFAEGFSLSEETWMLPLR